MFVKKPSTTALNIKLAGLARRANPYFHSITVLIPIGQLQALEDFNTFGGDDLASSISRITLGAHYTNNTCLSWYPNKAMFARLVGASVLTSITASIVERSASFTLDPTIYHTLLLLATLSFGTAQNNIPPEHRKLLLKFFPGEKKNDAVSPGIAQQIPALP